MTKREIYETAAPATLLIVLQGKDGPESIGSGVVISETGLAVTNHHVIEDALHAQDTIQCFVFPHVGTQTANHLIEFLKKHKHEAIKCKVLHQVPDIDIALLQLEPRPAPYRYIPLGDSSNVFPGDDVVCIGNPHGLVWSMTNGSVSAHRETVIQISAPISPGNSGGPLLNMQGELVGVNSFTHATGQNLNFARPSNLVRRLLDSPDAGTSTWSTVKLSKLPQGVAAATCRRLSVGQTTRHLLSVDFAPSSFSGGTSLIEGARVAVVVDASFRTYAPWWRSGQMPGALGKLATQAVAAGAEGVHVYLTGLKKAPYEYVGLLKSKNDATALGARFSDAALARGAMGNERNAMPALTQLMRGLGTPGSNVQVSLLGAGPFADQDAVTAWFRSEAAQRNSFEEPYALGLQEISIEVDHVEKRTGDPVSDRTAKLFGAFSERTVATPDAAVDVVMQAAVQGSLLCVGSDGRVEVEARGASSVRVGDAHTGRFRDGSRLDAYSVVPQSLKLGIEGGGSGTMHVTLSFDDLSGASRKFEFAW